MIPRNKTQKTLYFHTTNQITSEDSLHHSYGRLHHTIHGHLWGPPLSLFEIGQHLCAGVETPTQPGEVGTPVYIPQPAWFFWLVDVRIQNPPLFIVPRNIILYYIIWYHIISYHIISYHIILYYIIYYIYYIYTHIHISSRYGYEQKPWYPAVHLNIARNFGCPSGPSAKICHRMKSPRLKSHLSEPQDGRPEMLRLLAQRPLMGDALMVGSWYPPAKWDYNRIVMGYWPAKNGDRDITSSKLRVGKLDNGPLIGDLPMKIVILQFANCNKSS